MSCKIKIQDDVEKTYCNGCMEDKEKQIKEVIVGEFKISLCKECLNLLKMEIEYNLKKGYKEPTTLDAKGSRLFAGDVVKITSDMFCLYKNKVGFPVLNKLAMIKEINIHNSYPLTLTINKKDFYALPYDVEKCI